MPQDIDAQLKDLHHGMESLSPPGVRHTNGQFFLFLGGSLVFGQLI